MNCLSCQRHTDSKHATLWQQKIFMCLTCADLADAAKAKLDAAHRRAEAQALLWLEQQILRGGLLEPAQVEPVEAQGV